MIERADLASLLLDSSKFDVAQFERVCASSAIDALICEAPPPRRLAACLRDAGMRVIVADT